MSADSLPPFYSEVSGGENMGEPFDSATVAFVPGLELSRQYYFKAVRPILNDAFPKLRHSAALVGYGSDVVGLDTERSRDHMWGPRMVLFVEPSFNPAERSFLYQVLRQRLPVEFMGYPTHFGPPDEEGVRLMRKIKEGPVDHLIEITTLPEYFHKEIGWDTQTPLTIQDWLTFSEHKLLSLTSGGVWHDDLGLETLRQQLMYYPRDVWMYLLSAQWMKLGQEEAFVGRTAEVNDDLGSRIIAARLVQIVIGLAFLIERKYAPYSKWFGSAFQRLEMAPRLLPYLAGALRANNFPERESHLCQAYAICAEEFNRLGLIEPVETHPTVFHNRPYRVIHGDWIAHKIRAAITDERIRNLPNYLGSVNQFSSSVDLVSETEVCLSLKYLYNPGE